MPATDDKPIFSFVTAAAFSDWLKTHHAEHAGIWLRYFKKASGEATITHVEAVQEALCWGWIDGQARPCDDMSWLVKLTPRGRRSIWSQVNVGHVERLTCEGRMQPDGLAAVEAAKGDGRWEAAYASSSTFVMPEDFMIALAKKPEALALFESLTKATRYAVYHRLHTAKRPETRAKHMQSFLAMLQRGETQHYDFSMSGTRTNAQRLLLRSRLQAKYLVKVDEQRLCIAIWNRLRHNLIP